MCFHGWVPKSRDKLKIKVRVLGWVVCAHFSRWYLILLGPGAKESVVVHRASAISLDMIGSHSHSGSGVRSFGCWGGTT